LARKILLADDSVTAQNMGRKILADAGYEVITVNNGSAALKRVSENKPDLIVLDVYMPGYSGLEVCQRLKDGDDTAHIPVLLTVGKLEPFKPEDARRVRADAHIVKPFEASELLTAVMQLEDRVVATKSQGSRSGADNGRNAPGTDTGWKSRLGFPSKKKKEEADEEGAGGGSFREFRNGKGKSKAAASEGFGTKEAIGTKTVSGREADPAPDIPRDITPEELDALSAVAAKLDGASPAVEKVAAGAAQIESAKSENIKAVPFEAPAAESAAVRPEVKGFSIVASAPVEAVAAKTEAAAPKEEKTDTAAMSGDSVAVAVATPLSAVDARNEIEIPVEQVELPAETARLADTTVASAPAVVSESQVSESQTSENQAASGNAALAAPEPSPALIDKSDQAVFGSTSASTASSVASAAIATSAEVVAESATTQASQVEGSKVERN